MPNTEVKLLSADCSEGFPFVRVGRRHANCCFGGLAQLGEHLPYKQGVSGSIPLTSIFEPLAQLVEHLTFNQRVTGSSPCTAHIHISFAGVAELADALDLGSSAARRGVQVPSPAYLAGLAQLVEHLICNQRVEGSSPLAGTILRK